MKIVRYGLLAVLMFFSQSSFAQTQLAAWTFDALAATPNTPTTVTANLGLQSGTATLYADGTNGSSSWTAATELNSFAGSTVNDPRTTTVAGSAYCPIGGTSMAANGKAIVFKVSMTGYISLVLSYATRNTSTGFSTQQWAYSTDGSSFTNANTITGITTSFAAKTVDLSAITDLNNAATVYLKVTFTGATTATGNNRLDNIVVNATAPINDGDGTALLTNAFGSGNLNGTTIFKNDTVSQSVKIAVTGTAAGTLTSVSVTIPSRWSWTGNAADVAPSGDDGASLTSEAITGTGATNDPYVVTYSGAITNSAIGKITISNLTTPNTSTVTDSGKATFIVKTAKASGTLTALTNGSPIAYVLIPLANVRNSSGGNPVLNNLTVATYGTATVSNGVYSTSQLQTYMQDNGHGVNVFLNATPPTFTEGTNYIVKGQVTLFSGNLEVVAGSTGDIIENGASTTPAYLTVSVATLIANPEDYEGRLIAVQNVSKSSGGWPFSQDSTLVMTDGSSSFNLLIKSTTDLHTRNSNAEPSWPKDVRGIFTQTSTSPAYALLPRTYAGDIASVNVFPVELSSFTATVRGKNVDLVWNTATEKNNAGFEVQKSLNGVWTKIGYVNGAGNSNAPKSYSYSDASAKGTVSYRLKQIDRDGKSTFSSTVEATVALTAADYALSQNYPNPFNPSTSFRFAMKQSEHVTVTVYNMLGQAVATLFDGMAPANELVNLTFNASRLSSGIYFYSLRSATRNEVRKMTLMK